MATVPHERCVLRLTTTEGNEMNVLEAINYQMNGGGCPVAGSLGECAAITESSAVGSASSYHTAHLYLHSGADDLTSAEVASWFHKLGATDVVVSAVLYDKNNNILNGSSIDFDSPDVCTRRSMPSFWMALLRPLSPSS